jgi:hypothetical protein
MADREAPGLLFRLFGFGGQVQGHELVVREKTSESGRLARLPSAGQHHDWAGSRRTLEAGFDVAGNPHMLNATQIWRGRVLVARRLYNDLDVLSHFGNFSTFILQIRLLFASICMYNPARFTS